MIPLGAPIVCTVCEQDLIPPMFLQSPQTSQIKIGLVAFLLELFSNSKYTKSYSIFTLVIVKYYLIYDSYSKLHVNIM